MNYKLTNEENERMVQWVKYHKRVCSNPYFTRNSDSKSGIGYTTIVICRNCGHKKNITDYSVW